LGRAGISLVADGSQDENFKINAAEAGTGETGEEWGDASVVGSAPLAENG